jgi:hypothetical protein
MMGQQEMVAERAGNELRHLIMAVTVAALMAAMVVASALPAFATPNPDTPNPDSAAGRCGPPGQSVSNPELPTSGSPGPKVKQNCVPRH